MIALPKFQNKFIIAVILGSAVFLLILGGILYFIWQQRQVESQAPAAESTKEQTIKDALESLTAPVGSGNVEVPKKVLDSLTAPKEETEAVPQSVLDSLTAPSQK